MHSHPERGNRTLHGEEGWTTSRILTYHGKHWEKIVTATERGIIHILLIHGCIHVPYDYYRNLTCTLLDALSALYHLTSRKMFLCNG